MNKIDPPVCVVDDDYSIREASKICSESAGIQVETYSLGERVPGREPCMDRQAVWSWT